MKILVIGCSLNASSFSQTLAREAVAHLTQLLGTPPRLLDLREVNLTMCNGESHDRDVIEPLASAVAAADAILLAVPIYNYDVNAAAKNLIEHTGRAWQDKIVGFLCTAGGQGSFMAVMGLANSLMLDFRCLIVPRFVYATGDAFAEDGTLASEKVRERVNQLCREAVRLAGVLQRPSPATVLK